ncbi:hypothetical protein SmJEL517_g05362 [Synchytrium microbalum]|uniref:STAS domain-containing protein n=1 Tax=Synchytrium microbalum TaxID=1806994 RepID=A0A507C0Z1_9FUNG|nr:uncharacterized protein SmJEL517_g05362 [Synchytrium microbalum]TPX31235.1 hypothetical protein SmJEL517_g05362 [Synchytrium microbalum]
MKILNRGTRSLQRISSRGSDESIIRQSAGGDSSDSQDEVASDNHQHQVHTDIQPDPALGRLMTFVRPDPRDLDAFEPPESHFWDEVKVALKWRTVSAIIVRKLWSLLPIVHWLPYYRWKQELKGDLLAGLTVSVISVPQSIAFAQLAGMPPAFGLYTNLVPPAIYFFLGTSPHLSVGPVAVNSLFIAASLLPLAAAESARYVDLALLQGILAGFFALGLGLANLGVAVTFISPGVITGFTAATAIIIVLSQMSSLLGLSGVTRSAYASVSLYNLCVQLPTARWQSVVFGVTSLAALLLLRRVKILSRPSVLIVSVVATVLSWIVCTKASFTLDVVGFVPPGLPPLFVPSFNSDDVTSVIASSFAVAILGYIQSIAVAKKLAEGTEVEINPSQELVALGSAKLGGALFGGFDATGSISRSVVNMQAGGTTQMAAAFSVIVVIISLLVLTPLFYWLPRSTLAGTIIASAVGMVDIAAYKTMFRVNPRDFIIAVLTAVVTFGATIQIGLAVGVGASLFAIILQTTSAHEAILGEVQPGVFRDIRRKKSAVSFPKIVIYRFDGQLHFANVERFRSHVVGIVTGEWKGGPDWIEKPLSRSPSFAEVRKSSRFNRDYDVELSNVISKDKPRFIIVDGSGINDIDSSAAAVLVSLSSSLRKYGSVKLLFANMKGQIRDVLFKQVSGHFDPSSAPSTPQLGSKPRLEGLRREQFFLGVSGALRYAQEAVAFEEQRQRTLREFAFTHSIDVTHDISAAVASGSE